VWIQRIITVNLRNTTAKQSYIYTYLYEGVFKVSWVNKETKQQQQQRRRRTLVEKQHKGFMATKLTRLSHKIATQLHLVAEGSTIYTSRSRRPVRKLLDRPSYCEYWGNKLPVHLAVEVIPCFSWTWRFITVTTKAYCCSWVSSIKFTSSRTISLKVVPVFN